MNWREGVALALAVGITAGGAWVLAQRQARQRLGVPGVRVVAEPVFGEDKHVVGSNSVWLPDRVLDYQSKVVPINKIVEEWLPRDTVYGHRHYTAGDGFEVDQSVVLMGADRTSIHQPQYCLVGSGWRIEKQELTTIRIEQPYPYDLPVCKLTLLANVKGPSGRAEAVRGLFVYWFVADQKLTGEHQQMQWWIARALLRTGVLERWAYVTHWAFGSPGQEEALYGRLQQFIAAAVPKCQLAAGPRTAMLPGSLISRPGGL